MLVVQLLNALFFKLNAIINYSMARLQKVPARQANLHGQYTFYYDWER